MTLNRTPAVLDDITRQGFISERVCGLSKEIDSEDKVKLIVIGMVAAPIVVGLIATFVLEALKIIYGR